MRRNFLVTGGNRGIGKAIVAQLATQHRDNRVTMVVRDENSGKEAINDLKKLDGAQNIDLEVCDVGSEESINEMAERLRSRGQMFDAVINNAGIGWNVLGENLSVEYAKEVIQTNYYGPIRISTKLLPLLSRPGGRIIHVSSEAGVLKRPRYSQRVYDGICNAKSTEELNNLASDFIRSVGEFHRSGSNHEWPIDAYRTSKALLNGFSRVQAKQCESEGIFVASVCPGWVRTRMGGEAAPRSPSEGADTIVWLATENISMDDTGKFWQDRKHIPAAV